MTDTITMRRFGPRSVLCDGKMFMPVARQAGITRWQRNPRGRGWLIPAEHAADFEASAERMHLTVDWVLL